MSATLWLAALLTLAAAVEEPLEVRQLVTFDFESGKTSEALRIFREEALPLYVANEPLLRFRAYREVESPLSLDLVVVSSFRGMAGMDASNRALAAGAEKRGTSIGDLYGRIGALTEGHRDEFVAMDDGLDWGDVDSAPLVVISSRRLGPGKQASYRRLLREKIVPWEKKTGILAGSESGSYLVSDGLDAFRILGIRALADWQAYVEASAKESFFSELERATAATTVVVLAPVPELRVR